jgi:hypothetical protein
MTPVFGSDLGAEGAVNEKPLAQVSASYNTETEASRRR